MNTYSLPYGFHKEHVKERPNAKRPATVGATTNAAIFPMVITMNIKSDRPAVSFRRVERAMGFAQIVMNKE